MWRQVSKLFIGRLNQTNFKQCRTFAIISQKPFIKGRGKIVDDIRDYIENLNFKRDFLNEELISEENFHKQLTSICETASNSTKLTSKDVLSLLNHLSMCSRLQFIENFEHQFCRKIGTALPLMNIHQLYVSTKLVLKIIEKNNLDQDLMDIKYFILRTCTFRVKGANLEQKIKVMCIAYLLLGNGLAHHDIHSNFFMKNISYIFASIPQLVQIIHYIGLSKSHRNKEMIHVAVLHLTNNLYTFRNSNFVDIGVACSAMFKVGYLISEKFEKDITYILLTAFKDQNAYLNVLHLFAIISMTKVLYSVRSYDKDIMQEIKILLTTSKHLTPGAVCHLMSYFSNCRYLDEEILSWFDDWLVKNLQLPSMRTKDLNRGLVTFSVLGGKCSNRLALAVTNFLTDYCQRSEFMEAKNKLSDILFSLITMDVIPKDVCRVVFSDRYIQSLKATNTRQLSRIQTMYEVMTDTDEIVIHPPRFSYLPRFDRMIDEDIRHRPGIAAIQRSIDWLSNGQDIQTPFHLAYLINSINNCSLVIDGDVPIPPKLQNSTSISLLQKLRGIKICLDINDDNTSLRNVNIPNGIEKLKRNILTKRGWIVCVVTEEPILSACQPDLLLSVILNSVYNEYMQNKKGVLSGRMREVSLSPSFC